MLKGFKTPVPVINAETGKEVGEAVPATIVGAHLLKNYRSYLEFEGKDVACTFDPDELPHVIKIFPSKDIWVGSEAGED